MRIVTIILRLAPYGILGLIANTVAQTNVAGIIELGKFVGASYVALIAMFIIHMILLALFGLNPFIYVRKVLPVLSFAFTSRSSAGTIPLTIQVQRENLGGTWWYSEYGGIIWCNHWSKWMCRYLPGDVGCYDCTITRY
ncbi:L-cystine uptake protein TcyP [Gracilibacillus boraciitolerans JCM 21714]|uniref:L-cystine uptake protein TcyP n=1 Tax=Gracilibacillus boraciitolerans JCM 21714 TaxID=1298598 RepID=W4VHE5_9BACI|nr:L-cystine uptake protein TcyP [Gracilibacillus boraciitolerans JCM 21714]